MTTEELDPLRLDRDLRATATRWRRFRRNLHELEISGEDSWIEDPFESTRSASSRETFQRLGELSPDEPLRLPLRRWVYRLAEQRINARVLLELSLARGVSLHDIEDPETRRVSFRELVLLALREPERRKAWLETAFDKAGEVQRVAGRLWERRQEVARRMGLESPDALELCHPDAARFAEALLAGTQAMAAELLPRDLSQWMEVALAAAASEGFPSRLSLRGLLEPLATLGWFDGLSLDVDRLPELISAASHLRAFRAAGAAWVEAAAPSDQPFVIAHDPYGLRRHTGAALLAGLPLSPAFMRRAQGLGEVRLKRQHRALWLALLAECRSAALRCVLRKPALEGANVCVRTYSETTERALGFALPARGAFVVFRLRIEDSAELAGLLLAARRAVELRKAHDEDWYRNPRAVEELRSDVSSPPALGATSEELSGGVDALVRELELALG